MGFEEKAMAARFSSFLILAFMITLSLAKTSFAKGPTQYIIKGLISYESVKHQIKIMTKKVEKTIGISKKTLIKIGGTITQITQKKISTKLLNMNQNINNISIRPDLEYSFKTDEMTASLGVHFSF